MTLDGQAVQPERTRRGPSPQTTSGLLLAGAIIAPAAVLLVALTPMPPWLHDVLLFGPGLVLMVGVMLKVAEWDIAATQAVVRKVGEESGQLAVQVEANNYVLRQLSAAPTVRLEEARREMRATEAAMLDAVEAGNQETKRAVEVASKSIEGRMDELERFVREELMLVKDAFEAGVRIGEARFATIEGEVREPGQDGDLPGNVVAMPNPAVYQLGIAEGERRAREGREGRDKTK